MNDCSLSLMLLYVTVYTKTNHMSAKMFLRFSAAIKNTDLRCKFGFDYSLPAQDIPIFICPILKTNIPKMAIFSWNHVN